MISAKNPDCLLKQALQANAAFSGISGLVLVFWADGISHLTGIEPPWLLLGTGVGLIGYAAALASNTMRPHLNLREVWGAALLDVRWVVGSCAFLLISPASLTMTGQWVIGVVADIVAVFALLQFYGLSQLRKQGVFAWR